MQIQLNLKLQKVNVYFNNQVQNLVSLLSDIASQAQKRILTLPIFKHEVKPNFVFEVDKELVKTHVQLSLEDLTVLYQPALLKSDIEDKLGYKSTYKQD